MTGRKKLEEDLARAGNDLSKSIQQEAMWRILIDASPVPMGLVRPIDGDKASAHMRYPFLARSTFNSDSLCVIDIGLRDFVYESSCWEVDGIVFVNSPSRNNERVRLLPRGYEIEHLKRFATF